MLHSPDRRAFAFVLMLLRLGNVTIIYMHIHATYMYTHTICTYNTHNM